MKCPLCKGVGHLHQPHKNKRTNADIKREWARRLRTMGYSMREIAVIVGWKSVNSVTKALAEEA